LAACAYAQENESIRYSLERGVLSIPSISLTLDPGGLVSVVEEVITRPGDITSLIIPENVQEVQVLDSKGRSMSFEITPQIDGQLLSFLPAKSNESDESEEIVTLKYLTQCLTSKEGDVWTFNYSASATPQTKKYSGTIVKLYTPKTTRIKNINLNEGINFSPIGDSEIWFYPQKKEFRLNFDYIFGASTGPIITRPASSSTTTSIVSTTVPGVVDFRAYYLPWAVLLLVLLLFFLYKLKSRTGRKEESPSSPEDVQQSVDASKPLRRGALQRCRITAAITARALSTI